MKHRYSTFILWSREDESFIACVPELPGCQADGKTRDEALKNLEVVIDEWIETAKSLKRKVPAPMDMEKEREVAEQCAKNLMVQIKGDVRETVKKLVSDELSEAIDEVIAERVQACAPSFSGMNPRFPMCRS